MHDPRSIPIDQLESLCRRCRVRALWLFGSMARAEADPARSDADCLVEFEPLTPMERKNSYFGLREELIGLPGGPVDLVELSAIRNPVLRRTIESERVTLYAAA